MTGINAYKQQKEYDLNKKINTASNEELVMMLYDALELNTKSIILALEKTRPDFEMVNNKAIKNQNILLELQRILDLNLQIGKDLNDIYTYMLEEFKNANISKDIATFNHLKELSTDLKEAWQGVLKQSK